MDHTCYCNDLTNFEYQMRTMTGNGSYVDMLEFAWEILWNHMKWSFFGGFWPFRTPVWGRRRRLRRLQERSGEKARFSPRCSDCGLLPVRRPPPTCRQPFFLALYKHCHNPILIRYTYILSTYLVEIKGGLVSRTLFRLLHTLLPYLL